MKASYLYLPCITAYNSVLDSDLDIEKWTCTSRFFLRYSTKNLIAYRMCKRLKNAVTGFFLTQYPATQMTTG